MKKTSINQLAISTNGNFVFVYELEEKNGKKYTGKTLGVYDGRTRIYKKWYPLATLTLGFLEVEAL